MDTKLLMHGNTPAAVINISQNRIIGYSSILNRNHLPIGTYSDNQTTQRLLLDAWVKGRCIPNGRPGMSNIYNKMGLDSGELFIKSAAVSLTDKYWIKNKDDSLTWEDVNFHDNGFEPVVGNILSGIDQPFVSSPDFTTDGMMPKFWMLQAGMPFLVKMDNDFNGVMSANEVFVSRIAEYLNIDHVPYLHNMFMNKHVCSCPCFIQDKDDEYISALQLSHDRLGRTGEVLYHYIKEDLNLKNSFEKMIFLDCLIANVDRHEKNYGIIKKNTGEICFAPIFDSGSCLGYSNKLESKRNEYELKTPNNKKRVEIISDLSYLSEINKPYFLSLLQETYEIFDIPETQFLMAKQELLLGCKCIEDEYCKRCSNISVIEIEKELKNEIENNEIDLEN